MSAPAAGHPAAPENAVLPGALRALLGFAVVYLAMAFFSANLAVQTRFPFPIWPADGLALGVLLVSPRHRWGWFLGVAGAITLGLGLFLDYPLSQCILAALVNMAEPAFVAAGLLRLGGGVVSISSLVRMGTFFVNLFPLVAAISVVDALLSARNFESSLQHEWSVTFFSEFLGMACVAPLVLAWTHGGWRESRRSLRERTLRDRTPELMALFAGLIVTTHLVFGAHPKAAWFIPALAYLCAPFLIWAALRFGLRSATLGLAVFSFICFWHTAKGLGPFAVLDTASWASMLHLQAYLATVIVTTLFAAVLLSEREAAARTTEAWRRRHEAAIRASGNLLYELDPATGEFLWDGDTRAVLGVETEHIADTTRWQERIHPEDGGRVRALREDLLAGNRSHIAAEYRVRHGNGGWITVGVNGYAIDDPMRPHSGRRRIIGFVSDISERVRVEAERQALAAQLRQAEKMEAVGRLAGGIAHDFNNILGAILGYGELAQARVKSDDQLRRYLDTIVNAGNRAKALVDQILSYSRAEGGVRARVILGPVAREVCELLRGATGGDIEIRFHDEDGGSAVLGDPTRLHQLLMNLGSNAIQAMPNGGKFDITLAARSLATGLRTRLSEVAPGEYVAIEVKDTGEGIQPDVMDRIFEPFFTTKPTGRGTGLGLALVHSIVKEHGGAIDVASEPGKGTTFTVWLPRVADEAPAPAPETVAVPGNGQVVLAVDDEPAVLAALEEMLAALGFEPVGFTDSREALEAFRAAPERFEAVISDEVMPALTGTQLTVELRRLAPDIPVVIVSGYGGAGFETRALAAGANRVLRKPYRMQDIGSALQGLFASRAGGPT